MENEEEAKERLTEPVVTELPYTLKFPFKFGDEEIRHVVIHRPSYKTLKTALKMMDLAKDQEGQMGALDWMVEMCSSVLDSKFKIQKEMIPMIDYEDMGELQARCGSFLQKFGFTLENRSWLPGSPSSQDGLPKP